MKPVSALHLQEKVMNLSVLLIMEGGTLGYRGEEIIDPAKRMS